MTCPWPAGGGARPGKPRQSDPLFAGEGPPKLGRRKGDQGGLPRGSDIFMDLNPHMLLAWLVPWRQGTRVGWSTSLSRVPSTGPGAGRGDSVTLRNECSRSICSGPGLVLTDPTPACLAYQDSPPPSMPSGLGTGSQHALSPGSESQARASSPLGQGTEGVVGPAACGPVVRTGHS